MKRTFLLLAVLIVMNPSHRSRSAGPDQTQAAGSSRELVQRVLRGEETQRIPTGPLAVHFCANLTGISLREYSTTPNLLAESVLRYYERFRPDAIWLSADTWVSAQAMGAQVGFLSDDQPMGGMGEPLVQAPQDIDRIPKPDISTQGRYPLMLEALDRLRMAVGQDVFIVACFDQYPFSLAAALMGINQIMIKQKQDRPMVEALMERCLEYGLAYGRALGARGADMLSGGDSPAGLIGPRAYHELALPFEQRLIAGLKQSSPQPVSLHICGNALPLLSSMAASGADVLEIDHQVNLAEACQRVSPQIALWGNLDPVAVLAQRSAAQVRHAAQQAMTDIKAAGRRRFVLSSGCTLAMQTPPQNLEALIQSAQENET